MKRLTNSNIEIKTLRSENEAYWLNAYFKLKEYEDAEEQGRLLRLPCKVGDIVYRIGRSICHLGESFEDSSACLGCLDECTSRRVVQQFIIPDMAWIIKNKDDLTGRNTRKYWYLTREEAEKALERIVGNNEENSNIIC